MSSPINTANEAAQTTYGFDAYTKERPTLFIQLISKVFKLDAEMEKKLQRIYNIALNILGFLPFVSMISGTVRAIEAVSTGIKFAIERSDNIKKYAPQIAQVVRGALEAFVPFGHLANLALDIGFIAYYAKSRA